MLPKYVIMNIRNDLDVSHGLSPSNPLSEKTYSDYVNCGTVSHNYAYRDSTMNLEFAIRWWKDPDDIRPKTLDKRRQMLENNKDNRFLIIDIQKAIDYLGKENVVDRTDYDWNYEYFSKENPGAGDYYIQKLASRNSSSRTISFTFSKEKRALPTECYAVIQGAEIKRMISEFVAPNYIEDDKEKSLSSEEHFDEAIEEMWFNHKEIDGSEKTLNIPEWIEYNKKLNSDIIEIKEVLKKKKFIDNKEDRYFSIKDFMIKFDDEISKLQANPDNATIKREVMEDVFLGKELANVFRDRMIEYTEAKTRQIEK